MSLIKKPNQGPDIVEQAKEAKIKQKVDELKVKAENIAETLKAEIYNADIEIGDYKILTDGVMSILTNWFNTEINDRKMKDIVSNPSPEKENNTQEEKPADKE